MSQQSLVPLAVTVLLLAFIQAFVWGAKPTIISFVPNYAVAGASTTIIGTDLNTVTAVTFNGVVANTINDSSANYLNVTIPNRATSGRVTMTYSNGTVTSIDDFIIPFGIKTNPVDGAQMVLVPGGEFLMGTSPEQIAAWEKFRVIGMSGYLPLPYDTRVDYSDEMPQHKVQLDAYYMYKTEVTVAQYRHFCAATMRDMPAEPKWGWHDSQPIVNVHWKDAKAYADWAGVVLPTEAQWEMASRRADGCIYPWGNIWNGAKCANGCNKNFDRRMPDNIYNAGAYSVGSFPRDISPYGCLDMAGNVYEWTADWYGANYYNSSRIDNPTGPATGDSRVLRGGSWAINDYCYYGYLRCADRVIYAAGYDCSTTIGFRCASR